MNDEDLIVKLEESLQMDLGDWGRTKYLIKRIQNKQVIFQSDQKYINKILESMELKIQRIELKSEKSIQTNQQPSIIYNLIKCNNCDSEIELNQKAIRKNDFWFHEKCVEKIDYRKKFMPTQHSEVDQSRKYADRQKMQK